ncbi:MAG: hypothetical protein JWM27_3390 [Gemmatimonadetes bacterium]|nr:hypothetical protein [Gemmatimonadota bacterium]
MNDEPPIHPALLNGTMKMKAIRIALLIVASSATAAAAQTPRPTPATPAPPHDVRPSIPGRGALAVRSPQFADFPAGAVFRGRPAAVDVGSARGAASHRTVLRRGVAKGANFAGHYAVVTWGCGTACERFALVDVRTGKVWMSPMELTRGAQYRVDSGLFIANPLPGGDRGRCGSSAGNPCPSPLMLRGGRLVPLDSPPSHS